MINLTKIILFIILIKLSAFAESSKYNERQFISVGMLDENYSFVCIDGEKWLEHKLGDKIELSKIYIYSEEQNKDVPVKCN